MKNICILGSTGSIGQSSLDVIACFPDRFRPVYLTAHRNIELLQRQVERFRPKAVAVLDEECAARFRTSMNGSLRVFSGSSGVMELAGESDVDIVINSLVGFAGLLPTIEAIKQGKTVALANKETLVVAGEIITRLAREHHARLIPIDSEHSAILQCLAGENPDHIARLILTASGGPFRTLPREDFHLISVERALRHPNWSMGRKITIDSATLMNKGLEVIEAHWLFGLSAKNIEVLVHPQSIIHSMVEFVDGSIKAQLGVPDMKIPIQYALTYPERIISSSLKLDFAALGQMTFFEPDPDKFQCLALAYTALELGGTAPAILNAANEVAVELFLSERIGFTQIPELIQRALEHISSVSSPTLDDIIQADRRTRIYAHDLALSMTMKGDYAGS